MKLYVASSWRNTDQPRVVAALRADGHAVYDFRHPSEGDHGFHWSDIDPSWQRWTPDQFREALSHVIARNGFQKDFAAMQWADAGVLVLPCGRSAHLEAGWFVGAGKPLAILLADGEPELMYRMAYGGVCGDLGEVLEWARRITSATPGERA
jgi:hypothetical protein